MSETLKNLAEVHYGKSPTEVFVEDSEIPVLGTGGVFGRASRALFSGPAIIVPRKGSLGNPQFISTPFWAADTTYAVLPKSEVDARWLYYNLDAYDLTRLNEATGVPSINRDWLYRIRFEKPSFNKQRRIAEILATVDEAIEQTEALVQKWQQMKAGLMHDLFTRGVTPDGQLRPSRTEAPQLYQATPLGWIPKEWELSTLHESCEWFSGGTPSRSKEEWWSGNFPWLTPKDMKAFELSDTSEHVTKEAALFGSRIVNAGTVFIVVRGMILAHSFPVVLSLNDFAFNQDIKAVQAGDRMTNRFLAYWFVGHTDLFLKKTTEATHGTKRFDLQEITKMSIGLPKPEEQNAIIAKLDSVSTRINLEQALVAKLCAQKQGLMQDLLTGRVPVKITSN